MEQQLLNIVKEYKSVISKFKKRSGVLSGFDVAWKGGLDVALLANTPYGIGDALGTTGWCVSASEALLNDEIFQLSLRYRSAKAKLISIDIKEQYYGFCYNGSQNKWHTAILVEDSGFIFVVDITCRQFGNSFIEKDIWTLDAWVDTLRHSMCNHTLTNFMDQPLYVAPVIEKTKTNSDLDKITMIDNLRKFTNLHDAERSLLTDFYLGKMNDINNRMLLGNLNTSDLEYIDSVTDLLNVCPFTKIDSGFSILKFATKTAAKNWLQLFMEGNYILPNFMLVSETLSDSSIHNNIDFLDINKEYTMGNQDADTFVVFQFNKIFGIKTPVKHTEILLSSGFALTVSNPAASIFNAGSLFSPQKSTNTIYVRID